MSNPRAAKVAERIQQIIARRLEKGLRDPRMGFVTITDVRVTGDLQHASVFYTVYGTEEELTDTAAALKAATGLLRSEVGKQLGTRLTPVLEFIHDELPDNAHQLSELLAEAKRRDVEAQALAAKATYAGDEDPYTKPQPADPAVSDNDTDSADSDSDSNHDSTVRGTANSDSDSDSADTDSDNDDDDDLDEIEDGEFDDTDELEDVEDEDEDGLDEEELNDEKRG